jgi:hypothetical protein
MFRRIRGILRGENPNYRTSQQASSAGPDVYPGDAGFTAVLQQIYHGSDNKSGVSHDKINLAWQRNPSTANGLYTRAQIVSCLLSRYTSVCPGGTSCKAFLGNANITQADCVAALTYPSGYPNASGWQAWAGLHDGCWYPDYGKSAADDARWHAPIKQGAHAPAGTPYDHQPVDFIKHGGGIGRHGWNQSHPDVAYVWGWDPKENGKDGGLIGAHLGFQFKSGGADAIIWFTGKEAFLEAVREVSGVRRRISVGLAGVGQWTIKP